MRRGACKLQLLCYMYELEAAERVVHWLNKSVVHFVESIKEIIDEKFGNEIMSAIDFYCSVDQVGADGKTRYMVLMEKIVWSHLMGNIFHVLCRSMLLEKSQLISVRLFPEPGWLDKELPLLASLVLRISQVCPPRSTRRTGLISPLRFQEMK